MKAAVAVENQNRPQIDDRPLPEPAAGEVAIDLKAAALNHRDLWILSGNYPGLKYPVVLGSDGAGVIGAVGEGVSEEWIGQEVIIYPAAHWGEREVAQGPDFEILGLPEDGTFVERICLPLRRTAPKPDHLDWAQAAALPLAGLTAFRALFRRANLLAGEKLLVTGIGGGVAQFGLQFGLATGAEVWVTSSNPAKIEAAVAAGAAGGVNYRDDDWPAQLKQATGGGVDVALDGAAGPGFAGLIEAARPGARIVNYGGTGGALPQMSPRPLFWNQLSLLGSTMGSSTDFADLQGFVRQHQLVPVVDRTFPLDQVAAALDHMDGGAQTGKIVLMP